jgi:hypothetical protein
MDCALTSYVKVFLFPCQVHLSSLCYGQPSQNQADEPGMQFAGDTNNEI